MKKERIGEDDQNVEQNTADICSPELFNQEDENLRNKNTENGKKYFPLKLVQYLKFVKWYNFLLFSVHIGQKRNSRTGINENQNEPALKKRIVKDVQIPGPSGVNLNRGNSNQFSTKKLIIILHVPAFLSHFLLFSDNVGQKRNSETGINENKKEPALKKTVIEDV